MFQFLSYLTFGFFSQHGQPPMNYAQYRAIPAFAGLTLLFVVALGTGASLLGSVASFLGVK